MSTDHDDSSATTLRKTDETAQTNRVEEREWRGVAAEHRSDDLSVEVSGLLQSRSRRLLTDLLRPHKKWLWILVAIVLVENASRLSIPYLVKEGIDKGIPPIRRADDMSVLLTVVAIAGVAVVVQAVTRRTFLVLSGRIGQDILFEIRRRVYRHFQKLSPAFHDEYTSGRVISRQTSDMDALYEMLETGFDGLVTAVLTLLGTGVLLLVLDVKLGLVALLCFPFLMLLTNWFRKESAATYRITREKVALVIVHFVESMGGIRAVQAFRREPRNQEIFDDVNDQYRLANLRAFRLVAWFMPGIKLIGNVTIAVVLIYGAYLAQGGEITVGVLAAFLLYLRQFFEPMQEISQFYNTFQSATAALEKLSGVLEEEPSVPEPVSPVPMPQVRGDVRFDRVRFEYVEDTPVLPGLDLTIPAGQTLALVGTTGAGKTTIAKLLSRFYDPTDGRVLLDGVGLRDLDEPTLRRCGRHGDAGELPVRRHGRGQHQVRQAGRVDGGGGGGRPGDRGARLHLPVAGRLRHRRGQPGRPAVRGAASARRVRAGVPRRPGRADPRRGDELPRRAVRAAGAARAAHDPLGADGGDHRAPAVHGGDRRPGAGARARPDRRGRLARGPDRGRRGPVLRPARGLAGLARVAGVRRRRRAGPRRR